MDKRSDLEMVAYALEAAPDVLPFLPELLADLEELGSDAEWIAEVVADLPLSTGSRVIDLGCGKGAVAIELAAQLQLAVTGVELFEPFIPLCENQARQRGVADLCHFVQGNIVNMVGQLAPADVVIFAALGDVIGRLDETVKCIRQFVKPGGYVVISDVMLAPGASSNFPGFERYAERDESVRQLVSAGDRVVREELDDEESADSETKDLANEAALIAARAKIIAERQPEVGQAVLAFANAQAAENAFIDANLIDVIWVLQRQELT